MHFAITKVANKEPEPQPLPIILMDDHENEYEGELTIDLALKEISTDILRVVPKRFSYVDTVIISMPKVAPIEKVRLGEKEWKFSEIKFGEQALKLYPITSDELPPLVGQGPREIEEVFIEAYQLY